MKSEWVGESDARRLVYWPDFDALSSEQPLWAASQAEESDDLARLLRDALCEVLSERQRAVVEAYFFEGLSQGEIALRLGIRQQVVHKCIYGVERRGKRVGGALQRLRKALESGGLP